MMKRTLVFTLLGFFAISAQAKKYSEYFRIGSSVYYYRLMNAIDATEKAAQKACKGWDHYTFKNDNWERADCYSDVETKTEWTVVPVQNYTRHGLPYTTYVPQQVTKSYNIYACYTTAYCSDD